MALAQRLNDMHSAVIEELSSNPFRPLYRKISNHPDFSLSLTLEDMMITGTPLSHSPIRARPSDTTAAIRRANDDLTERLQAAMDEAIMAGVRESARVIGGDDT